MSDFEEDAAIGPGVVFDKCDGLFFVHAWFLNVCAMCPTFRVSRSRNESGANRLDARIGSQKCKNDKCLPGE